MHPTLRQTLQGDGAVLDEPAARPLHFGDPAEELRAARQACVLADRSNLGRILATGPDLLGLLHRLSTKSIRDLAPGDGRPTVLTSPKGRIVERLFVHHLGDDGLLLVTGPEGAAATQAHLDRYTIGERTGLVDVTADWYQLALVGPAAGPAIASAGLPSPQRYGTASVTWQGTSLHVLGHDGLSGEAFSVVGPAGDAATVWRRLLDAIRPQGGGPAGDEALEAFRVLRGVAASGHELTEDHNPLEAGLWDAVDFDKGCYVGQEVVARLRTYDKIASALRGLRLPAGASLPAVGTPLFAGARRVGRVTSAVALPGQPAPIALGYVKRGHQDPGTELSLGEPDGPATVHVAELPFD